MADIFPEPSGVQALQCASKCFSPSRMPLRNGSCRKAELVLNISASLRPGTYTIHILSVNGVSQ